ncbi:MAG: arginine--tRNA ligase [Acidobacteria bacterium]|nr:arginine--tRNA ligase [Acidobacteriota bacterium]MBF85547.1 arginine--tRNA ligase [Acidobacteriota bacterium]MCH2277294.1 arginine--tRNA ligase [Vicinamibacterales bacterium]
MILPVHEAIRTRLVSVMKQLYGVDAASMPSIAIQVPPSRAIGDLAVPVAFELARVVRKAPQLIAQDLAAALGAIDGISAIEPTPNGYVNFFLDRRPFLAGRAGAPVKEHAVDITSNKTIVEHTAINPNKAAHIGHLRNAVLGDTLCRLLRFQGRHVEIQNYIDDTGVQVADMVVAFREFESMGLAEVRERAGKPGFDYYCWDLYAKVTEWYEADSSRLQLRAEALHALEAGDNEMADTAVVIADRIVRCHLTTMAQLNIGYDLLAWESDILRLRFWAHAFDLLRKTGVMFQPQQGRLAGCWVMPIEDSTGATDATRDDEPPADIERPREKVIVRSNGTVTYVGKDIAYQCWKFGLLNTDFHYRHFSTQADNRPLWATSSTSSTESGDAAPPAFGRADTVYNVIDTRQAYLQQLLAQALRAMGHTSQAEHSVHFSYEMVALSHDTARTLGFENVDKNRPFVEVSGRKGLGVKADELLERLTEAASHEVTKRNPDLSVNESTRIAKMIATAAVRYFMIKFSRGKVIIFDIEEALSFEGESGPYLQYAVVRANNIFRKLLERTDLDEAAIVGSLDSVPADCLARGGGDDLWDLVFNAARLDEIVDQAIRSLEPSVLAKYAFGLAQAFNAFYHRHPIVNEAQADRQRWRAAAALYFKTQMTRALAVMGCEVPSRM